MSINKNEILLTNDGSPTLRSGLFGETYHSMHGAISESRHVFIKHGLQYLEETGKNKISILELGFGTGLNALLSYQFAVHYNLPIDYHTIELYPISKEDADIMDFKIDMVGSKEMLKEMHQLSWGQKNEINSYFFLTKYKLSFEDYDPSNLADIIYHDAFAPSIQELYWEAPFLKSCYEWTSDNGILVSYCAKGSFKRALKEVGYKVESLPGAPGKREMTRATKI